MNHKNKSNGKAKRSSLLNKYLVTISSIFIASFIVLGIALIAFIAQYWTSEKMNLMQENVKTIASETAEMLDPNSDDHDVYGPPSAQNSTRILLNMLSTISTAIDSDIVVCNINSGKVLYCKEQLNREMIVLDEGCAIHDNYVLPQRVLDEVREGSFNEISNLDGLFNESKFIIAEPIVVDDTPVGVVVATRPVAGGIWAYTADMLRMFAFASLLSLLIAFVVIYMMSYRMIKPLRQMSAATRQYSKGDFSYRVAIRGNDELAELAEAFNSMAKALATIESSRRSFIANVSHELKTPMTSIGGFIDGILDGTIPEEKREQYLKIVSDEIKRLSRLVTGMLNMSKIEAGELKLNPTRLDLSDMVFKTLLSFEQLIDNSHIDIQGLEDLESVYINADESMINQVVYNLIDNAVKFTPEYGCITINIIKSDDGHVIFSIRNTGNGISSEEIVKIFERFYKVDKSRSYDVKGAGLGLYIVKTIIEMHNGKIRADSKVGEYTEFSFEIPSNL